LQASEVADEKYRRCHGNDRFLNNNHYK
jgi:hypothetical protein